MNRDECYSILEVSPGASEGEIRDAWRELNKVWHPDRFGDDEALRRRAEEKLKKINQAYAILKKSGAGAAGGQRTSPGSERAGGNHQGWAVRDDRREIRADSLEKIARWILAGKVTGSDEVWDPRHQQWLRVTEIPELARILRIRALQKWTRFALFAGMLGFFLLIRRPVGLNAVIGLTLIRFAVVMMWIYRSQVR